MRAPEATSRLSAHGRTDAPLPLRRVEFHILLSLAAAERHGYGIIQDIEARRETAVPVVYTTGPSSVRL